MASQGAILISGAAEGPTDEAVLKRLLAEAGAVPVAVYGQNGKQSLRRDARGYNNAAMYASWFVLVDLDQDAPCPSALREEWLPEPARRMCFRVAVREVEAWLLGDRERISAFLGIGTIKVPRDPETLVDPKRTMVDLARQSRRRDIREDMVPRPGSGRLVGPAYTSRMIEFATDSGRWRLEVAAENSRSLGRCRNALKRLIHGDS